MSKIRKAVIPAAGLGTRFYPLTITQPKEMLPLLDKPVIHYVVEEAARSGLDEILIVTGSGKGAIKDYFNLNTLEGILGNEFVGKMPHLSFVTQRNQLGLADAINCSRKFVNDEAFAVLLGDTVYRSENEMTITQQMLRVFDVKGKSVLALEKVPEEKFKDYGMVGGVKDGNGTLKITDLVEKPLLENSPGNLGITGLYALEPEIFGYIKGLRPGHNGELQLTDALRLMSNADEIFGFEIEGKRFDIGNFEQWIVAFLDFLKNDSRYSGLMKINK